MNRPYITEAIAAILEDIFLFKMAVPYRDELDAFFEPDQLEEFKDLVRREFDVDGDTIVDTAATFGELIALLEDELAQ
jgi:hypothetical protein